MEVALRREGDAIVLEVADDGVGLPPDLDSRDPGTPGLKLVRMLTEQLGGTIDVDRREGTRFLVRFARGADS